MKMDNLRANVENFGTEIGVWGGGVPQELLTGCKGGGGSRGAG